MKNGLSAFVRTLATLRGLPVMVGRIGIVQRPRTPAAENEENLALWYELGHLCREAGGGAQRATKLGLTSVCATGALVLLSAPVFGTAWAGPFAAAIPVAAGLLSGGGLFLRQRFEVAASHRRGQDAARGAWTRRRTSGAGRARRVLRCATRLAEKRVRVPAGAGRRQGCPTLRNDVRLHPGGLVRDGAFERGPGHAGDAGVAREVGT